MDLLREKMRLLPMSGPQDSGGGGGGSSTGTQTNIAELPEWAKPYAQNILAKGEALTTSTTPATYGGERYAGLSDLQKKAIESVSTPEAYQKSLQGFMDPYAQNVIDIQKREANRQSQMAGLQEAGAAVKSGAFGGSRAGLVEAERARNTGQLLSDIQQRGSEAAFQNAQQALQRDIANKMQIGSMQQADIQRPMDIAYQDFLNQQNYPYKQLGFMSDLLRGTPTGQSTVTNMYQPISGAQTLAGLGLGAYGMSKLFAKDGGLMESTSYAEGGSVDSPDNVAEIVGNLSDQQLEQAAKMAQARGDFEQLQIIQAEKALRVSERGGLAGAFNNLPYPTRARMAGGGIVAFNEPTAANNYSLVSSEDGENDGVIQTSSPGLPGLYGSAIEQAMRANKKAGEFEEETLSPEEIDAAIQRRYALEQKLAGTSPYGDLNKHIAESEAGLGDYAEKAKGFAALKAMSAVVQPGGLIRSLGAAGGAFGDAMEKAEQATRAEKRSLASMKFNLKDAERKERMGMTRSAVSAASEAIKDKRDAERNRLKVLETQANVAAKIAQAAKPVGSGGRPPQPKESVAQIAALAAKIRKDNPGMDEVDVQDSATRQYFSMNKPGTSGAVAKTYGDAQKEFRSFVTLNKSKVDKIVNDRFGGDFEAYKEDQIGRILQGLPTDIYSAKQPGATRPKTTARGSTPALPPGAVLDQ